MDLALTNEERAAAIRRFWEGGNLPLKYNTRNLFRPETHDRAIILREYISSCRSVFARRTIQTLPDDILFNIFNEAVRRSHDNTQLNEWGHGEPIFSTPVTLSHVSRRFRRAALSCRNLWVHVNNDMFEDQLSAYLHRSGSAGLIVALNLKVVKDDRLCTLWAACDRWKELIVHPPEDFDDDDSVWSRAYEGFREHTTAYLPKLEVIDLSYEGYGDLEDFPPVELVHFYYDWTMPQLRTLKSMDIIPDVQDSDTVTTYEFSLNAQHLPDWNDLFIGIGLCSNLKHLKLDIGFLNFVVETPEDRLPYLCLEALETFTFNAPSDIERDAAEVFFKSIYMPNMTRMFSECNTYSASDGDNQLGPWLDYVFVNEYAYPSLSTFAFALASDSRKQQLHYLDLPIHYHPRLQHFQVEGEEILIDCAPGSFQGSVRTSNTFSPLRTLTLKNCDRLTPPFISSVLQSLQAAGGLARFEKLEIDNCPLLTQEAIERIVGDELMHRVVWTSEAWSDQKMMDDFKRTESDSILCRGPPLPDVPEEWKSISLAPKEWNLTLLAPEGLFEYVETLSRHRELDSPGKRRKSRDFFAHKFDDDISMDDTLPDRFAVTGTSSSCAFDVYSSLRTIDTSLCTDPPATNGSSNGQVFESEDLQVDLRLHKALTNLLSNHTRRIEDCSYNDRDEFTRYCMDVDLD